jgi:hypothetical protein
VSPLRSSLHHLRAALVLPSALALGACVARGQGVNNLNNYLPPEILSHDKRSERAFTTLGMFDLNPRVAVSALYDNNITLRSTNQQDDFIFVVSPGIDITKADVEQDSISKLRLSYSPALVFFAKNSTNNSIDHFVHFDAGLALARLKMTVGQEFSTAAGSVSDVANRVNQTQYRTSGSLSYEVSEKTTANLSGNYRITEYEQLIPSEEWSIDIGAAYQVTPKVSLGLGVSFGELQVGRTPANLTNQFFGIGREEALDGGKQRFASPSLRASYRTTEKTDVSASVGAEWRQYEDGSSGMTPVFSLAGTYRPWEATTLSLEGHRREQSSAVLSGQNYVTTGFGFRIEQKFLQRYRGHLSYSYDVAEYQAAKRGVSASRVDDYFLLRYGVDVILAPSWSLGVFHQYRENTSSSQFNFETHQVGVQTVWAY